MFSPAPSFWRWRGLSYLLLGLVAAGLAIFLATLLKPQPHFPALDPQAGGITTLNNRSSHAFGQPAPGLSPGELAKHAEGDVTFDATFITAPARVNPGLGPLFNNSSCVGCHIKNGRGMPQLSQALVRVSLPVPETVSKESADLLKRHGALPLPEIGTQVRDQAIYGHTPDADVSITWQTQTGQYPDGVPYELRFPTVQLSQRDPEKPIPENVLRSLRIPPPVFGVGLLEAIPERTLKRLADPQDRNRDNISGRLNQVWNLETQRLETGRFGLKANSPNLRHQTAAAYVNDMGVTNPLFPEPDGTLDIDEKTLDATTFYVQSLGVPVRTLLKDATVQRGEKLFAQANCSACHVATLKTGSATIPALSHQTIHPYTDLLLHDMGEGLADGRPDFAASGQEWRTAPLWGLGLTQTVLPYSGYLHDGRARTLEEAILWHGGEAETAKQQFMALQADDRQALLRFLNSL